MYEMSLLAFAKCHITWDVRFILKYSGVLLSLDDLPNNNSTRHNTNLTDSVYRIQNCCTHRYKRVNTRAVLVLLFPLIWPSLLSDKIKIIFPFLGICFQIKCFCLIDWQQLSIGSEIKM